MRLLLRRRLKKPRPPIGWARRLLRLAAVLAITAVGLTVVLVLPWRWLAPPTTAFILRERLISKDPVHYHWVPLEEIASTLPISAVAAEDQKFPDHFGFDWEAIENALERNSEGGRVRGGSTISQQLAKNLFLWPGQNWIRKGTEAWFTVSLELLWPKRRILEVYLNVAEFGPGVFGVAEASNLLLGKSPSDLTAHDAAILVAVLPSPKRMSAADPSEYVRTRSEQIQAAVRQLGGPEYLTGM
jgi:monofunctional biosynthetic peptidoglycan transglycosylase